MFTSVPAKSPGDVYSASPMWNTYLADNLNKGVVRPIAETTLLIAAASIDFTSIAADWSHLLLVSQLRGDTAATDIVVTLRFNNDSGANYDWNNLTAGGAVVSASQTTAATSARCAEVAAASAPASVPSGFEISIPNYAATTFNKSFGSSTSHKRGTGAGDLIRAFFGGHWRSSVAINRITLLPSAGNFAAGGRVTLYGMGGI